MRDPAVRSRCANGTCGERKPDHALPHCPENPSCRWWICLSCHHLNDGQGHVLDVRPLSRR